MLPFSRNTTYGDGTAVRPADLDDIQDCIIGAKHGNLTLWKPTSSAVILTNIAGANAPLRLQTSADAAIVGGLSVGEFLEGTTILGAKVRLFGTAAAGNVQCNVQLNRANGTIALLLEATIVNPPAAWEIYALALDDAFPAGYTLLAGDILSADLTLAKNGSQVGAMGIVIARS